MQSSESANSKQIHTIDGPFLDEEFRRCVFLAHDYMKKMRLSEDRRVCARYINQCAKMASENVNIKFHRNRFFRYLLKAMIKTIEFEEKEKRLPVYTSLPEGMSFDEKQEFTRYSDDNRTYISAKVIPGYATLIYMAVTNTPEDGWDYDGFAKLSTYIREGEELKELERKLKAQKMKPAEKSGNESNTQQENN